MTLVYPELTIHTDVHYLSSADISTQPGIRYWLRTSVYISSMFETSTSTNTSQHKQGICMYLLECLIHRREVCVYVKFNILRLLHLLFWNIVIRSRLTSYWPQSQFGSKLDANCSVHRSSDREFRANTMNWYGRLGTALNSIRSPNVIPSQFNCWQYSIKQLQLLCSNRQQYVMQLCMGNTI